ncbi:MAG: hypothetical protein WBY88_07525 [Desulfosarcina sp.]
MLTDWRGVGLVLLCGMVLIAGIDQATKDALKVAHILKSIERHPSRPDGKESTAEVTETELNAYIAHRLKQENNQYIRSLQVDLLDNNQVRGKIRFDAKQLNLSLLMGENLDFNFTGVLCTRNGAGRLDLISLVLGGQPVNPQVLDFVLNTVSRYQGSELGGIGDWYELPTGIKRIAVRKTSVVLTY